MDKEDTQFMLLKELVEECPFEGMRIAGWGLWREVLGRKFKEVSFLFFSCCVRFFSFDCSVGGDTAELLFLYRNDRRSNLRRRATMLLRRKGASSFRHCC